MTAVRVLLACGVAAGYAAIALSHEDAQVMAVGLAPLALLAIEGAWRLFDFGG